MHVGSRRLCLLVMYFIRKQRVIMSRVRIITVEVCGVGENLLGSQDVFLTSRHTILVLGA